MSKIEVELQHAWGGDEDIAMTAWVSTYNKDKRELKTEDPEAIARVVRMCIGEGHSVPVEAVELRFWIRMPVFADRQHVTHRIAEHNGLSGRYRTLPDDFYPLPADVLDILAKGIGHSVTSDWEYQGICREAHDWYRQGLKLLREAENDGRITNSEYKRARESMRSVIPTSVMTERMTKMNLHSFANYQRLRNSHHAQAEIRQVARLMLREVIKANVAPVAVAELMRRGWLIAERNDAFTVAGDDE